MVRVILGGSEGIFRSLALMCVGGVKGNTHTHTRSGQQAQASLDLLNHMMSNFTLFPSFPLRPGLHLYPALSPS